MSIKSGEMTLEFKTETAFVNSDNLEVSDLLDDLTGLPIKPAEWDEITGQVDNFQQDILLNGLLETELHPPSPERLQEFYNTVNTEAQCFNPVVYNVNIPEGNSETVDTLQKKQECMYLSKDRLLEISKKPDAPHGLVLEGLQRIPKTKEGPVMCRCGREYWNYQTLQHHVRETLQDNDLQKKKRRRMMTKSRLLVISNDPNYPHGVAMRGRKYLPEIEQGPLECKCGKYYTSYSSLGRHVHETLMRPEDCERCEICFLQEPSKIRYFKEKANLNRHIRLVHEKNPEDLVKTHAAEKTHVTGITNAIGITHAMGITHTTGKTHATLHTQKPHEKIWESFRKQKTRSLCPYCGKQFDYKYIGAHCTICFKIMSMQKGIKRGQMKPKAAMKTTEGAVNASKTIHWFPPGQQQHPSLLGQPVQRTQTPLFSLPQSQIQPSIFGQPLQQQQKPTRFQEQNMMAPWNLFQTQQPDQGGFYQIPPQQQPVQQQINVFGGAPSIFGGWWGRQYPHNSVWNSSSVGALDSSNKYFGGFTGQGPLVQGDLEGGEGTMIQHQQQL